MIDKSRNGCIDFFSTNKCGNAFYRETIDSTVKALQQGISRIPSFAISLTNMCNSKCITCDYWRNTIAQEFDFDYLKQCIDDFKRLETKRITLTGGEPLLYSKIYDVVELLYQNGFNIHIMTNGILLNKMVDNFTQGAISEITISMDGANACEYAQNRGIDAFDVIVRGIKKCVSFGIKVRIRVVLQKNNYRNLLEYIELAKSLGALITFQSLDVHSAIAYGDNNTEQATERNNRLKMLVPEQEDIDLYMKNISSNEYKLKEYFEDGILLDSLERLRAIGNYFSAINKGEREHHIQVCNMPLTSPVLDYDMSLRPCFYLPGTKLNNKSICDVINSEDYHKQFIDDWSNGTKNCKWCVVAKVKDLVDGLTLVED